MVDHLERHNANIARAMHQLGAEATEAYEGARDKVASFIGAPDRDEVIFTKNASEALNLAANTLAWPGRAAGRPRRRDRDHRDGAPLQHRAVAAAVRADGRDAALVRRSTDDGRLDLSQLDDLVTERTKVVSFTWVSNMLGTINPVAEIARRAHQVGALVVVDASQAAPQLPIDLARHGRRRAPDLLAFTGHKVVGPTGIGVLWGRRTRARPAAAVPRRWRDDRDGRRWSGSTYAPVPHKFEAGTPPIVEAVGLGAAVDYLTALGMDNVHAHEQAITALRTGGAGRRSPD